MDITDLKGGAIEFVGNSTDLPIFPEQTVLKGFAIEFVQNAEDIRVQETTIIKGFAIEFIDYPIYAFQIITRRLGSVIPVVTDFVEKFNFGPAGSAVVPDWTSVFYNPGTVANNFMAGINGSGISVGTELVWPGAGGGNQCAFPNGYPSGVAYLDKNGNEQVVPQEVMQGIWGDFKDKGLTPRNCVVIKGLPVGVNVRFQPFASFITGGGVAAPANTVKWQFVGLTTINTDGTYAFCPNTDDRVDGVVFVGQANALGEARIYLDYGGPTYAFCPINALIVERE